MVADKELKMAILHKLMEEMASKSAKGMKPKADVVVEAHGEAVPKGEEKEEMMESPHEMMMEHMHPEMEEAEMMAEGGKPKLGTGKRFSNLEHSLANKGAENPGALAAYIGRKKYGAKGMSNLSHKGHLAEGGEVEEEMAESPSMDNPEEELFETERMKKLFGRK